MKNLRLLFLFILLSAIVNDSFSQGGPPPWAPAHGYRAKARYTYFPTLSFYFDTKVGIYFFLEQGIWVSRNALPVKYKNYNWSKYRHEEFEWGNNHPWEKHHGNGHTKSKVSSNGKGKGHSHGKKQ